jgi:hypothetical protein
MMWFGGLLLTTHTVAPPALGTRVTMQPDLT